MFLHRSWCGGVHLAEDNNEWCSMGFELFVFIEADGNVEDGYEAIQVLVRVGIWEYGD